MLQWPVIQKIKEVDRQLMVICWSRLQFILLAKAANPCVDWARWWAVYTVREEDVDLTRGPGETGGRVKVLRSTDLNSYGGVTYCYCATRAGDQSCDSNDSAYMSNDKRGDAKSIQSKEKKKSC